MRILSFVNVGNTALILCLSSCSQSSLLHKDMSIKKSIYDLPESSVYTLESDDKISLSIWDHDNLSIGSVFGIYNSNEVYGKWVMMNQEGVVTLPKVGPVQLKGLTIDQAQVVLVEAYSKYILNPIIALKVLNREVSVLGEVKTPGTYLLEKEQHSLLEYLSKAGGLNFYADSRRITLIRDKIEYQINLNNNKDLALKNLKLVNGDVIHVPTLNGKRLDKKAPVLIPFTSVLTSLVIVFSLFKN